MYKQMRKKTKNYYGVEMKRSEATAFNFFQNNYGHMLPAMNTIHEKDRKEIVLKWLHDRAEGIEEQETAAFIQNQKQ